MDPETVFATPCRGAGDDVFPKLGRWTNFQIAHSAAGYSDRIPYGGPYTAPPVTNSGLYDAHAYVYPLIGAGQNARFRLRDLPAQHDHSGRFKITVRLVHDGDCETGRWKSFAPSKAECLATTAPNAARDESGLR